MSLVNVIRYEALIRWTKKKLRSILNLFVFYFFYFFNVTWLYIVFDLFMIYIFFESIESMYYFITMFIANYWFLNSFIFIFFNPYNNESIIHVKNLCKTKYTCVKSVYLPSHNKNISNSSIYVKIWCDVIEGVGVHELIV